MNQQAARDLVAREALVLDEKDWDSWLDLYTEDAVFWVPAWRSETELTSDPDRELSLMYLDGRRFLAERVQRVRSGRSIASTPAPRTVHLVTGSIVDALGEDSVRVRSAWLTQVVDHRSGDVTHYAGRYEHTLVDSERGYRISRKTIAIVNDQLVSQVDFFYI